MLIVSAMLVAVPVFADDNVSSTISTTTTGTPRLTAEEKILEAQKKLEERYQDAKVKLQEKLSKLQTKQVNETAAAACVGSAVVVRENSIKDAFNVFSQAQLKALSDRSVGLTAAWAAVSSTPKQIKTEINKVWATYNKVHNVAVKQHNASTTAAWNTYKKAVVVCKASQAGVSGDFRSLGQDMVR